eukprot:1157707-Pelagomonas_calceolata.AAC.10
MTDQHKARARFGQRAGPLQQVSVPWLPFLDLVVVLKHILILNACLLAPSSSSARSLASSSLGALSLALPTLSAYSLAPSSLGAYSLAPSSWSAC